MTDLAKIRRLQEDFPLYAQHCLKIRTKSGTIRPLVLNPAQKRLHEAAEKQKAETGKVRIITVKGRQQGSSTYIGARGYHQTTFRKGWRAFILTHEDDATKNLFEMVQRYHENNPIAPTTKASNVKELDFALRDSGYRVGTAGTRAKGRSQTVQFFHGSEVAFWPNAQDHKAGVMQAVPDEPGTEVWLESTGNGIGNVFHQEWLDAEAGISDFIPVFLPWYIQPEYTRADDIELDDEERDYQDRYGLTLHQMAWRRHKLRELGDPSLFAQEYPATPLEAFQASSERILISPELCAIASKNDHEGIGPKIFGVDVARFGGDRSAVAYRQGRKLHWIQSWTKLNNMALVGRVKTLIDQWKPDKVFVDSTGMGSGVADRLREMGYDCVDAVAGANALNQDRYVNRRAEMWDAMKEWLRDGDIPPGALESDLSGLHYDYDSRGRLKLESKEDAKKRGVMSPDLGDALGFTFYEPVAAQFKYVEADAVGWMG